MNTPPHLATILLAACLCSSCSTLRPVPSEDWTHDWKILATWSEGGTPSQDFAKAWTAGEMTPGKYVNRPYYDASEKHTGILELHPLSDKEPARIRFSGVIPLDRPVLVVVASGNVNGDCVLKCVVNGATIAEFVLDGSRWTTCTVDLSTYLGQPSTLEIWDVAGGKEPWHFEHCYLDQISFRGR